MAEKLTTQQRDALDEALRRFNEGGKFGALPGRQGMRSKMGGAYRRMLVRLAKRGLLTDGWPYAITDAGRRALNPEAKP